jgi:hypothetical protein
MKRTITYIDHKSGKINTFKEGNNSRLLKGHDTLTDLSVIEANSFKEAKQLFHDSFKQE